MMVSLMTMTIMGMTMTNITNLARQLDGVPLIDDDRFRRRHKLWVPPHNRLLHHMDNCYFATSLLYLETDQTDKNYLLKEFHLHMCVNVNFYFATTLLYLETYQI